MLLHIYSRPENFKKSKLNKRCEIKWSNFTKFISPLVSKFFSKQTFVYYSYLFMYPLHKFNIQWFQTMSGWSNEIQAYMDSWISDWKSFHFGFRIQEIIILIFHIFDNWIPAFRIVDCIAETCKKQIYFHACNYLLSKNTKNICIVSKMDWVIFIENFYSRHSNAGKTPGTIYL